MLSLTKPKLLIILAIWVAMLAGLSTPALAATPAISLVVNGTTVPCDVSPIMANNRVLVPIRFAAEPLGAYATYENKTALITLTGINIKIPVGELTAYVNDTPVTLDVAAQITQGRTMVPMRFIAEALGAQVGWDQTNKIVSIAAYGYTAGSGTQPVDPVEPYYPPATGSKKVIGYYFDYRCKDMVARNQDSLDIVAHYSYLLTAAGSIKQKDNYSKDLFFAEGGGYQTSISAGITPILLVTGFDATVLNTVLPNANLRASAIQSIVNVVAEKGFLGVDLDFEAVKPAQKDNFVAFVKELKQALSPGQILTLSITAREKASFTWLDGYDHKALANAADYLILMCYDQHYNGGTPGPVAAYDWVERVINYTLSTGAPKEKVIVGLGCYGRSWPKGKAGGSSVYLAECAKKAVDLNAEVLRDPVAQVPYYYYTDTNGVAREMWYEDTESLSAKASLVKKYDLGGVALWRLGITPQAVYEGIVNSIE